MNASPAYQQRRDRIETYFDRTAVDAWARMTSEAPLGRIRASVRAGRDLMRATILHMLPGDLRGRRLLDAGCGTGALAIEAARRGADVVAVDLSEQLIGLARKRAPADAGPGSVHFMVGDMLAPGAGKFDHVVAMDSLIHYPLTEAVRMLGALAAMANDSIVFTFAPRTPALAAMHAIGRLFPSGNRAPAIEPVDPDLLQRSIASARDLRGWDCARSARIAHGFYTSQCMELVRV